MPRLQHFPVVWRQFQLLIRGNLLKSFAKLIEDGVYQRDLFKGLYNAAEISLNAERCRTYKIRQEQVRLLQEIPSEENLWQAVIAFQDYPFKTATGLPFRYKLKVGKNGEYNRELLIDRREKSKSLAWRYCIIQLSRQLFSGGQHQITQTVLNGKKKMENLSHLFRRGHFLQRFMRVYIGKKNLALNSVVLQKKEECQKYLCFHWMNHRLLLVKSIKIIPM